MTTEKLDNVHSMLGQVSADIKESGDTTHGKIDELFDVMDDLAANILAVQAVTSALCKKYPIEMDNVNAWIEENMNTEGQGAEKTAMLAEYLTTNK